MPEVWDAETRTAERLMATPANPADPEGSRPVPDPTVLTTEALHREITALKELVFERIAHQQDVRAERFDSVDRQFKLIEDRRVEQKNDTQAAIEAALSAQKEAALKSEAATTKSIEEQGKRFEVAVEAIRVRVDDLKERMTGIEGQGIGGGRVERRQRDNTAVIISALVAAVVVIGAIVAIANAVTG